jgi:dihydroorotate dehydrogenase electron transfer subunit
MSVNTRDTIIVEQATVLSNTVYPAAQYVLRLRAPEIAALAGPGCFVHLRCSDEMPMRRPMSIMHVDPESGCFDVLFKVVGSGTERLSRSNAGDALSLMGPIGRCFEAHPERPKALLIGGGVGIPPMLYLADSLQKSGRTPALVLMGSEVPFPFENVAAKLAVPGVPIGGARCVPELEALGIRSRLASAAQISGCHQGYVTELARIWLDSLTNNELEQVAIYACGPNPMLRASAELAAQYGLPCQVSLEEFMACAVGGCAGCAVLTHGADGPAMRRVCVDGPVFDGADIDWPALSH